MKPRPPDGPEQPPVCIEPGAVLEGKYRLERELGRGGMGVVFEATHLMLGRKVAIKVLSPAVRERPDMANRMIREARSVSTIGHPNIVAVTDLGLVDGTPFIVMELLVGVSLEAELAQRGTMVVADAIGIVAGVLDALDAVHRRGIVHRDIKPANVMLVRDAAGRRTVKVLDFGIAKITSGDETSTKTAFVLGTPQGMAPEQALGEDIDGRADLHAVGSLLYTLLVGEPPFAARGANAAVARMLDGRFTPASQRVPSLPAGLDAVIARALARAREDRWPDAVAMRDALQACLPGAKAGAKPTAGGVRPVEAARALLPEVESLSRAPGPPPVSDRPQAADARFSPTPLERLDMATMIDRPPVRIAEVPAAPPSGWLRPLVIGVVVIAAGFAALRWFMARSPATSSPTTVEAPADPATLEGDRILLMVSTSPKDAAVFVDHVRIETNPVELPRSDTPVSVRVEAKGYVSRVIQVEAVRSRRVEITLERQRR